MTRRSPTTPRAIQAGFAFAPDAPEPLVLSYGLGVDSTAVLVGWRARGIRPDAILFADVGCEKPETYAYRRVIDRWLARVGFPPITAVRYVVERPRLGHYATLEEECLLHGKLPSLAYGMHTCSAKWKVAPQQKWVAAWAPARRAWADGRTVRQAIGFDAGTTDQRRTLRVPANANYTYLFPLLEWGWDRARCVAAIEADADLAAIAAEEGMPAVPMKSACFMCPASKPHEIAWLAETHPALAARVIAMERAAAPRLVKIEGLWRRRTKTRPGSMTEFLTGVPLACGDAVPTAGGGCSGPASPDAWLLGAVAA